MRRPVLSIFLLSSALGFLITVATGPVAQAGSVAAPYQIGTWEGFRPAAISYTFDDDCPNQYAEAVPMFHAAGLKMTLFTVTSWLGSWSQVQLAASYGDEIASHTVTHASLGSAALATVTNEEANSQSIINSYITDESCLTLAYPNCTVPSETITAQYYIAARVCSGTLVPSSPPDFLQISSYILGNTGPYTTGDSINNLADNAFNAKAWCVYLTHAIDGDSGYSPLSSTALQASVNYTSTNQSKFWVETFGNVVRYIKERNASSVAETSNTGNSITVQVTNNLDNSIYNYPITLRRPLPANWPAASVTQNGRPITVQSVAIGSTNYVMFDVVPNGGDVVLAGINASATIQLVIPASATEGDGVLAGQGSIMVYPNPTNDLVVNLTSSNTNKVTVPSSVVIPAGQSNAVFDLTIIGSTLLDGDQTAAITAVALNYGTSQATILVHNNNTATLTVTLPATATKGAGTLVNAGLVSVSSTVATNYTVTLVSSDTSKLTVPATAIIPTGQTSAGFNLNIANDGIIDGSQNVSVTAHVPNWTNGSASMTILDVNPLPDHFTWSVIPSPQWMGGPFHAAITARDAFNNIVDFRLPVTLSAFIPGSALGTNTLLNSPATDQSATDPANYPDYSLGYSFTVNTNLYVTHVRSYFGDKVSIWGNSGQLLATQAVVSIPGTWVDTPLSAPLLIEAGAICRVAVNEYQAEYFWSDSLPNTFANGTINQTYWDAGDVFPASTDIQQWYYVDVRYGTDLFPAPINPVTAANFTNGTWSGNIAVLQPATNVMLQAVAGPGSSGASGAFNVLGAPSLAIAALSNSVVLSWPTNAAGFTLEQAVTMSNWTNDPATPVVVSNRFNVTNAPGAAATYYRLYKP